MNTEIYQKILNKIPHKNKYLITEYDILDYITNLQEENERLKKQLNNADNKNLELIEELNKEIDRYEDTISFELGYDRASKDYKSRIDKAIEKLKFYNDKISNMYVPVDIVLNILNGSDE